MNDKFLMDIYNGNIEEVCKEFELDDKHTEIMLNAYVGIKLFLDDKKTIKKWLKDNYKQLEKDIKSLTKQKLIIDKHIKNEEMISKNPERFGELLELYLEDEYYLIQMTRFRELWILILQVQLFKLDERKKGLK